EYFEFIRRDSKEAASLPGRAELTPEEVKLLKQYNELVDRVTDIGVEISLLEAKGPLTTVEGERLAELVAQRTITNRYFNKFLDRLAEELEGQKQVARVEQISESKNMDRVLNEVGGGAVVIYTLVTEKKYRAILVTPYSHKATEYPIRDADLNKKVLEFREALENPRVDPRPLGRELYGIMVAPIAKDLR